MIGKKKKETSHKNRVVRLEIKTSAFSAPSVEMKEGNFVEK